jgi:hypothetical protein
MMETDKEQFDRRYGNVTEAIDKFRDALLVTGPSRDEHLQAMRQINEAVPGFFMDSCFALAAYTNNQEEAANDDTVAAFVALIEQSGEDARYKAQQVGADVLAGALNDLGITLRVAGKTKWEDKTPDA